MFLSAAELKDLTGRRQFRAQIRALIAMGVEFKVRPDGSPVVLKESLYKQMGVTAPTIEPDIQPNWAAM